ncbi:Protein priB [Hypsizygus marmoreus]|uniref:Protein priB n=1 Tax=Hypsizygus marmoreus TaxID=39966 RepID=A0A369JM28_HYPMA|nr:Protein priB [Hypsizygus marmoreus]
MPTTSLFRFSSRMDDSDSAEENDEHIGSQSRHGSRAFFKSTSACVHCKSLKVKCEFSPGEKACNRCQAGNYQCLPRQRKKRKPAPTHEDLQKKAHDQDIEIQNLLHQFDKLKADSRIKNWMMRSQSVEPSVTWSGGSGLEIEKPRWGMKQKSAEVAAASYFSPGPVGEGVTSLYPPDIVKYCALYPEEIMNLFSIYFERINPFFSILDPELHTPWKLIWTSPFLFTVICAVASRYYMDRPSLYLLAMDFARDAAGRALIDGSKSIDVYQAYLILAVYPVPKKKWAEDRSWLLMGVAIRMAIELELNQPPPAGCSEREHLNRTRTWLNCYCVDGSHAIQFGKMPMLRLDDYLARNSREWYKESPMNLPFDVHLCAYVQIIILMAEWRSEVAKNSNPGSIQEFDLVASVLDAQTRLSQELAFWVDMYAEELSLHPLPICEYRGYTTRMITAYLRLVVLAVGFQHAAKSEFSRDSELVLKSIQAAREVIQIMVVRLFPTGNLRFAMEANFLYVSYAAAFLINLLRPKFLPLLNETLQGQIIHEVGGLIDVLGSTDVALDGRHTPALYSRFLSSLLSKHNCLPPRSGSESPPNDPRFHPQYSDERPLTPPQPSCSWPDVMPQEYALSTNQFYDAFPAQGDMYQGNGPDMDFTLSHFVRTVTQGYPNPSSGVPATNESYGIDWNAPTSQPPHFPDAMWRM